MLQDLADYLVRLERDKAYNLVRETLAGSGISEMKGILNGTTNYILTQMEAGMDYAAALKQAQELSYAEAVPDADVLGCSIDVSCTTRYVWEFGFVDFPFMSFVSFAAIGCLLGCGTSRGEQA